MRRGPNMPCPPGSVKVSDGRCFEKGSAELVCAQMGYSGTDFQYCVDDENDARSRKAGRNLLSGGKRRKSRKSRKGRKSRKSRKQRRN